MKSLFLSPHNDDETLFGAYTIIREKPLVVIITDAWIQTNRGEKGCDATTRWLESVKAMEVLDAPLIRIGIKDFELQGSALAAFLRNSFGTFEKVYAPALQEGNPHHDLVSQAAKEAFGDKVIYYSTYKKGEWFSPGDIEIIPTPEEKALKEKALSCYTSQINLPATKPHFEVAKDKSEWLIK